MVAPDELAQFCELLKTFLSSDNRRRKEAEQVYQATKQQDPDRLCRCLITVLTEAHDDTLRQQSAVLLRQCLKSTRNDFVWPQLPPATQEAIKARLIVALRQEPVRITRHKVCDAVSMLASYVLDPEVAQPGGWNEISQVLSELVEAAESGHRESALRIIKDMLCVNPPVVSALLNGKMALVLQVCHTDSSPQVRKESVLLFAAVLECLPPQEWKPIASFMPIMLTVTQQFESHEDELHECLEAFVQVAGYAPAAFQPHLDQVVPMMLTISRARDHLLESTRQMAFEFLVAMCENRKKMCARHPNFIREAVNLCMEFMLELEDEDDWADISKTGGSVDVTNYDVGEENIDRFARALGAERILDDVFANVRAYVGQGDSWKHRYAAIMTLSQCAETVEKEEHVDQIVGLLVSFLQDAHPRVRYAALHAIGQTSADHSPYLQEQHCELVMPALLTLMDDQVVRVASHACAAFINFAEDLDYEALLPYVPGLMQKLCQKMVSEARVAREQAITAIAVIAGVLETDFVPYYWQVVPALKQVILTCTRKEERALRGKAFECMSLLGLAVGREVFQHDATEAMQAMMETASRGLDADDPQRSYIHEAAQRVCRALRENFIPYLQYLLPGIYSMLQLQPVEVADPDAEEEEADMTVAFLEDGKAMGLKTSQIEDFQSAVQMLTCFLEVLGGHYFEHIRETARCLLPALTFQFSDDVKREAIQTWQELLNAAKAGLAQRGLPDDGLVPELLRAYLKSTLDAMRWEEDLEILQVQAIGTTGCVKAAGPNAMTAEEVQGLCVELRRLIQESTQRQWETAAQRGLDEDELAEAEYMRDTDQLLRIKYAELVGSVMQTHPVHFLQAGMPQFVPIMQECLLPSRSASDRCLALYLASDMAEKLGQDSVSVWPVFMSQLMDSMENADPWVRQAAAYGVLHAAKLPAFGQFADRAAKLLGHVLSRPRHAGQEGAKEAAEAAVAALGQLCRSHGAQVQEVNGYLLLFLNGLPLVEDADQASPTHELLMELFQSGHPLFQEHMGKVCRVFLEVYDRETSSDRLNLSIRMVFQQVGHERLKRVQPPFNLKENKRIQKIIREADKSGVSSRVMCN